MQNKHKIWLPGAFGTTKYQQCAKFRKIDLRRKTLCKLGLRLILALQLYTGLS